MRDLEGNALSQYQAEERATLARVQQEALNLERLPEGEEPRPERPIVDGHEIAPSDRLRGKLSVRW